MKLNKNFKRKNINLKKGSGQKLWREAKKIIPGGNMFLSKKSEIYLPNLWPSYFKSAKGCIVKDLDNKSYKAWAMLAQAYNASGRCYDAKDAANEALDIKKRYASALFDLGLAEKCLGNKTLALKAFNNAKRDRNWRRLAEIEIEKINNPKKYE